MKYLIEPLIYDSRHRLVAYLLLARKGKGERCGLKAAWGLSGICISGRKMNEETLSFSGGHNPLAYSGRYIWIGLNVIY